MATLDHQIRKALAILNQQETTDRADFSIASIGMKTIDHLIESGWATASPSLANRPLFSITEAGQERLRMPSLPKPTPRRKLTTLEPRIKPMEPRLK